MNNLKIEIKEQLFLTKEELQILEKVQNLLSEIYQKCLDDGRIEKLTIEADNCISEILKNSFLE